MRLRLVTTDRDPFWIIGDPELSERDEMSLALGERIQITRNQQAVSGAEWETQVHHDRKNQRVVLSANVRREFASEWERMDFLAQLACLEADEQLHRWEGDVWLRLDRPGGDEFREWLLQDTVVGIAGTELDGAIGLRIAYTVSCGGFSGDSQEVVQLIASGGTPVFGFSISGALLDGAVSALSTPDTFDFLVELSTTPYGGGSPSMAQRYFAVSGGSYDLPMSGSMADYAADMDATFGTLIVSYTGGVFTATAPTLTTFGSISMMVIERHYNPYSSLIPGDMHILTATPDDEEEDVNLTATFET